MTAPALAARFFGTACLLGAGLGLLYGFLRPLRPRHTLAVDGLFVTVLLWTWICLAFGICVLVSSIPIAIAATRPIGKELK